MLIIGIYFNSILFNCKIVFLFTKTIFRKNLSFIYRKLLINNYKFRFIGEETVSKTHVLPKLTDAPTWIIDPIDGTTNFVHSFPHACISIALAVNRELEIGIVYNPVLEQMFTARRGRGAYLNGKPIKTSDVKGNKIILSQ